MPRRPRIDRPGLLHHIINRALARRTAFESQRDIRMFLSLLARAVREGRIEVHAYSILSTHFHLLVRSLDGRISETMQHIENTYVRWFNRTRRRDGPLFRGRFRSFPVESARYLHVLFRYIDQNPIGARLASNALAYPHGSAGSQSGFSRRRPWLCRALVDLTLAAALRSGVDRVDAYQQEFGPKLVPALRRFVDRRITGTVREPDVLDDLVGTTPPIVRAWMERKARLADGTRPGLPMATPESVVALVDTHRRRSPGARIAVGRRTDRSVWDVAVVALLRDAAGETFESIARRATMTLTDVWRRYAEHRNAIRVDSGYADVVADLARCALEQDHATLPIDARVRAGLADELSSRRDTSS